MTAAANASPTITPPTGLTGPGCTLEELATVIAIGTENGTVRMGRLPDRIAQLFQNYVPRKPLRMTFPDLPAFVQALHPDTMGQIDAELQRAGVPADRRDDALCLAAKPLSLMSPQMEAARQSLGWTKKSAVDRQRLPTLQLGDPTISGEHAYEIAKLFWQGKPMVEVVAIQGVLSKRAQSDYYTAVWNEEEWDGLERLSGVDGFDAEAAWKGAAGAFWDDWSKVTALLQRIDQTDSPLASAARPAFERIFRKHERQLLPTTMFDPKFSAAKSALSRRGLSAAEMPELPDVDPDDVDAIEALPEDQFRRIVGGLSSGRVGALYGRSVALNQKLLAAIVAQDFPDFSEWMPPSESPLEMLPPKAMGHLLAYLDIEDIHHLLYLSRRLNARIGNPNLETWQPVVEAHMPHCHNLALQAPEEWHGLFADWLRDRFLEGVIDRQNEPLMTPLLQGKLIERNEMRLLRQWDGHSQSLGKVRSIIASHLRWGLWPQLVATGADLPQAARDAWWFAVGQQANAEQVHEIILRFPTSAYDSLRAAIEARTDDARDDVLLMATTSMKARRMLNQVGRGGEAVDDGSVDSLRDMVSELRGRVRGIEPVVRELEAAHEIVRSDIELKAAKQAAIEVFQTHPNLMGCYRMAMIKISEVFRSAQAVAGGLVQVGEGALSDVASKVEFFGDMLDLAPMIGPVADKLLKHTVVEGLKNLDQTRQTNLAKNLSRLATDLEILEEGEKMARWLVLTYEPQLRLIATGEQAKQMRGKVASAAHKASKTVTYSKPLTPAESFAHFGVFCLFNLLRSVARGKMSLEEKPLSDIFVDVVSSMRPRKQRTKKGADPLQRNTDKALGKIRKKVRLVDGNKASLAHLFIHVGIQGEDGATYGTDTTYGFCNGTREMAERRGLAANGGAAASNASAESAAASTPPSDRPKKGIRGRVGRLMARKKGSDAN
jgi:hypothetical protein